MTTQAKRIEALESALCEVGEYIGIIIAHASRIHFYAPNRAALDARKVIARALPAGDGGDND
jgi:hypothetical protein